jgi:hypothetical protein
MPGEGSTYGFIRGRVAEQAFQLQPNTLEMAANDVFPPRMID